MKKPKYKFELGDAVNYSPVIGGPPLNTIYTVLDRWQLSNGEKVYRLSDKTGCVSEEALQKNTISKSLYPPRWGTARY